jgi:peptidyl-prolyl cis-trans isomerase C
MRKALSRALTLVLLAAGPALAEDVTADTVVAEVDGVKITVGHMIAARDTLPPQYLSLPDDVLFTGILDQIVQQTALAKIGEQNLTRRDLLVIENERRAYLAGVVLDDTAANAATEDAIAEAYAQRYSGAEPSKEFNAAHILVETEDAAREIKAQLDAGADFTALAKERSTGPSGPNGGELGWFSAGMMVKPFEDAVIALEPGEVSDPVETQFGWHVIRLGETRIVEAPALDEVREELAAEIQARAVQDRLTAATAAVTVTRSADGIDPAVIKNRALLDE